MVLTLATLGWIPLSFSRDVDRKLRAGDRAGAQKASRKAEAWGWICLFVVGVVLVLAASLIL